MQGNFQNLARGKTTLVSLVINLPPLLFIRQFIHIILAKQSNSSLSLIFRTLGYLRRKAWQITLRDISVSVVDGKFEKTIY